nr:MAG: major capsid protein [Gokushovirinae sp.]
MLQRNKSSNFSLLPQAHIQRSVFDRSSSHKFTFNVGDLIPFYVDEVLPGSTHQIRTSKMVRLQTPATPFMDDLYLDTYYFFVPNRLVWDNWKEFQGENNNGHWVPSTEYQVPQITLPSIGDSSGKSTTFFAINSIADYMGLPAGNIGEAQLPLPEGVTLPHAPIELWNNEDITFNALPFRAYCQIVNDWFRDQNLSDPLYFPTTNTTVNGIYDYPEAPASSALGNTVVLNRQAFGGRPYRVCKYHDYFTSALPSPLKGEAVKVPITNSLEGSSPVDLTESRSQSNHYYIKRDTSGALVTTTDFTDSNILGISNYLSDSSAGISINDLRLAFATQAQFERDARGGTRYTELLRSNFGVISPDASLQRSQYLGGNHFRINVNQVVQQAGGAGKLGDVAAFSATADSNGDFIQSFTEHGFIIGVCCARYNHSYQEGAERFWFRKKRFDYYMPAFANIGEQAIKYNEIYIDPGVDPDASTTSGYKYVPFDSVFGYQEAWSEYRMKPNRVSGEMRSNCANTLDYWHLADHYGIANAPYLSDAWIREDPSNVDRVLTVSHKVSNQIFADFYIENKTTQPIPMYSIPATLGGNF